MRVRVSTICFFSVDGDLMLNSAKRRTKRQWDEEWGKLTTEGNIWWLGSVMQNWRAVMGDDVLTWICECVV
jgi:hypothetical protein